MITRRSCAARPVSGPYRIHTSAARRAAGEIPSQLVQFSSGLDYDRISKRGCLVATGDGDWIAAMKFIEMTGKTLMTVIDDSSMTEAELRSVGVTDDCLVRINQQGDIELRRSKGWDVIGGLLGEFEHKVKSATGHDWA